MTTGNFPIKHNSQFMFRLYQLVFNFTEAKTEDGFSYYEVFKDFFWPLLLAGLAVWGAFIIFKAETRRDEKKAKEEDESAKKDKKVIND